jgi:hypothetical protein
VSVKFADGETLQVGHPAVTVFTGQLMLLIHMADMRL